MGSCFRCERTDKEVKLFDAIYSNDIVKICERCAVVEDMPVIKKPSTSQLKDSERSNTVYERLKILSGMKKKEESEESILDQIRKLDEHPELEKPDREEKRPFNLIDNFHWHVTRARRNKGLSQKQLAWAVGESESAIKMIEKAELPEDAEKLIRKLEQFFQMHLRERTEEEIEQEQKIKQEKLKKAEKIIETEKPESDSEEDLEDEEREPIKPIIQEPEIEELEIAEVKKVEEPEETEPGEEKQIEPARVLSFKPEAMNDITISDLKNIKDEKEREERLSALEEERKKELQAQSIVEGLEDNERKKQELREKIAQEMRDTALGEDKEEAKKGTIEGKRVMLDKAVSKLDKKPEQKPEEKKEAEVPTITELMEKKEKEKQEKMTGDEIEIAEEKRESSEKEEVKEARENIIEKTEEKPVEEIIEEPESALETEEKTAEQIIGEAEETEEI